MRPSATNVPRVLSETDIRGHLHLVAAGVVADSLDNPAQQGDLLLDRHGLSNFVEVPQPLPHRAVVQPEALTACHGLAQSSVPSRPGEFHPGPLTEPCVTVSRHTARATQ